MMPTSSLEWGTDGDGTSALAPAVVIAAPPDMREWLRRGAHACIEPCAGEATFGQGDQVEHVVALVQNDPLTAGASQNARAAQFFQGSGCGLGRHVVNPANARGGEHRG